MGTVSGTGLSTLVLDRTGDRRLAEDVRVVAQVLPFKVNSYVTEELIDWSRGSDDPIFRLVFPHRDMLPRDDFESIRQALENGSRDEVAGIVGTIRERLNPHPSDQLTRNIPQTTDFDPWGLQHKYRETLLIFPRHGQTCHSYCGYCFRWAQFVQQPELRQETSGAAAMTRYLQDHPEITDVLLTGGDPLVMRTALLERYLRPFLDGVLPHVTTIRLGTKALSFWPYRFLDGPEADTLLELLARLVRDGRHVALMLHVSHPRELETDAARQAIRRLYDTGAVLRSQAPLVRHVNDDASTWSRMWSAQVRLGIVPYYLFVERDTGASRYFGVPLVRGWQIYRDAIAGLSGLGRTARGPVMSAAPGKVVVDGPVELDRRPAFALRFLQARRPELVGRPFFAAFDPHVQWWDELKPYGPSDRPFFAE
ncbi:lysine 2,3-aminomutase [Actinoplanes sp. NEAU-A11]|uniref:Lysine 2,3-aminomutase n=1 Tax=Actinoplanes aureus TaxID=2792083 RepID=A0A931G156_9ACTN|nr:lysine 2,3-aminomutase [Actinoplanes aureus]